MTVVSAQCVHDSSTNTSIDDGEKQFDNDVLKYEQNIVHSIQNESEVCVLEGWSHSQGKSTC